MVLSASEENYLKAIWHLQFAGDQIVSTNSIAAALATTAASVTEMLKRLADKKLVRHKKYKGTQLTSAGFLQATRLIRKHRLWEYFLVEKLNFGWDEVHDIAEELEHIQSALLTERLSEYLDHPKFDPHGDPIPDADGKMPERKTIKLSEMAAGSAGHLVALTDHSSDFMHYLDKQQIKIGTALAVMDAFSFDKSREVKIENRKQVLLSGRVCENLLITPEKYL